MRQLLSAVPLLGLVLLLSSCHGKRELSPEEQAQLEALRGEAATLSGEIDAATEQDSRYSGGLIKGLIGVRLEILRTTKALVDQRIQAIEAGSPITVVTAVTKTDPARASTLAAEMERAEANLEEARREADLYSGGLVAAMKMATVATQEQTLAMLRQQFVFAKYGLTYPGSDRQARDNSATALPAKAKTEVTEPRETPKKLPDSSFQIVDISTRVTESNSTWWKYAWKLTLRSTSDQTLQLDAHIEFLDQDGFVVDDARESNLILRAGEESTFTGYELIDADVATNVKRVNAKVNRD